MEKSLLPANVRAIQTSPGQAFTTELYISILIGVIVSVPLMVKEIFGFIFPAFTDSTRLTILKVFIPSILLFIIGALFAYLYLVPFTIEFLYRYGESLDLVSFFNIADFIPFVLQFLLGVGFAFELPIIMYAISMTGLVNDKFWKNNFRYAILAFAIFGAIITPDGSGVTMWFVALPMIFLYLVGMIAINRRQKGHKEASPQLE
jgi:sec-independent protein translocase protein TatC